jgi:3-oxoacyl-[acyl-carrier-protein] synthase II
MGWTTPLGDDLDRVWRRLLAGETGMIPVPSPVPLRNNLAAVVPDVPLDRPAAARMSALAVPAARRALDHAGRKSAGGVRLVLGTSYGSYLDDDPPEATAHAWADRLADEMGFGEPPVLVASACSAGSDAILIGAELVRSGAARCCLCGGVDVVTLSKRMAHSALGSMSPTMLRAFDIRHDGTLLGDGAAFMVLEPTDAGASALAFVTGTGSSSDAAGMTSPDATGGAVRLAVERALSDAGIGAGDVGLVKAHGSGTPLNDSTEREALRGVFEGGHRPTVFSTKGNLGHSLGATGAIEAVAVIMALQTGKVPPIAGLENPDPEFGLPLPRGQPADTDARFALCITLGFGGFDTCLVLERCA